MKRLLLILTLCWLPLAALAQTAVKISVTYTQAAANKAAGVGSTVEAQVNFALTDINAHYSGSSLNANWTATTAGSYTTNAPADSKGGYSQYKFAHDSPSVWAAKKDAGADIAVHVYDSTEAGATIAAAQPASMRDGVIAIPIDVLNTELEKALARIMNAGSGFATRIHSNPDDPPDGTDQCYHTVDSAVSSDGSANYVVPAYWSATYTSGGSSSTAFTKATQAANTCSALRSWFLSNAPGQCPGGSSLNCAFVRSVVDVPPDQKGGCWMQDSTHTDKGFYNIGQTLSIGSTPVTSCTEQTLGYYSKNGNMPVSPFFKLGDASHDSVTPMNAQVNGTPGGIATWHNDNSKILNEIKGGALKSACRSALLCYR